MFNSLRSCNAVMDRVGMFFNVVLTMFVIFLKQEIVFSFMDKTGVGVGGFMRAASGTKSIKDREPGLWTEVGGQGYGMQLAEREAHQTCSKNRFNLFALSFIHSTPYPSDRLISCYYLHHCQTSLVFLSVVPP